MFHIIQRQATSKSKKERSTKCGNRNRKVYEHLSTN